MLNDKCGELLGKSRSMKKIFHMIEKAASVDFPVLIEGETGSGKELVASEIHKRSQRGHKPFVAVNMGLISPELVASELFGHEKGAFTGAVKSKSGYFQKADGGTLFLDELLTMKNEVQVSLLRALESKKIRKIAGEEELDINVRILAATNDNPAHAVQQNRFRSDLLHRLQVIRITIPPLRKRKNDIPILVHHFLEQLSEQYQTPQKEVLPETMHILKQYDWPGNVRELNNVLSQATLFSDEDVITPEHLPQHVVEEINNEDQMNLNTMVPSDMNTGVIRGSGMMNSTLYNNGMMSTTSQDGIFFPVGLSMKEVERAYILKTMSYLGNNKSKTAKILGICRKTLYMKLEEEFSDASQKNQRNVS